MRYNPDDYDCSIKIPYPEDEEEGENQLPRKQPSKIAKDSSPEDSSSKEKGPSKNKKSAIEMIEAFSKKYREEKGSTIDKLQKFNKEYERPGKKTIIHYDPDKFDPETDDIDIDDEEIFYDIQDFWVLDD